MSPFAMLSEISRQGIRIRIDGQQLAVSREGLTTSVADDIRLRKQELMRALRQLQEMAGDYWEEISASQKQFRALVDAVETCNARDKGDIPTHYTAIIYCRSCERRVPHFPLAVDTLSACVWCMNGLASPEPRRRTGVAK